jgi:hypothetical protein
MTVLSKPLLFNSRYTHISPNLYTVKDYHNSHFWIDKNGVIIDPTEVLPGGCGRRIYIPFEDTLQKEIEKQWHKKSCKNWDVDDMMGRHIIKEWLLTDKKGAFQKCYYNALNYQLNNGGKLVCGAMGHYSKKYGYVDLDYGF